MNQHHIIPDPERILILDGAFGTMAQSRNLPDEDYVIRDLASLAGIAKQAADERNAANARGCHDVLCITRPDVVEDIHRQYLAAGADIITTNSFNANAISLADYGLQRHARTIARRAAEIARKAANDFDGAMVAGSIGPTNRTLSMSPDVNAPAYRECSWQEMYDAYHEQAQGLIEGGADLILIETVFDTLNAKAAIKAVRDIDPEIPIVLSCTVSDASGRTLSGQTIEAFCASVAHARPAALGLNCGYGAKHLLPYARRLAAASPAGVSVHPNAGLPNIAGGYDETPQMLAADMEPYITEGLVDIIGGCCGTTPAHIAALAALAKGRKPRGPKRHEPVSVLSGLEPLKITHEANFINIGERCNVAGSAKFARLIREGNFQEAVQIARDQVDAGAQVVDVCMDDAMINAPEAMRQFLNLLAGEPEIARVPLMIDSSSWPAIEAGMQCAQGKSIVNSISLKEGEKIFLDHARQVMAYGCAAVVMLFDEKGQADTYERKIEVAARAYKLLTGIGFAPEDIIFDPNILAVATGMPEHDHYAKAFIDATAWIKENLPLAKVSGGVSNLSFAFRGNNPVRKAMHAAFLYHAIAAGMDMGLVNPQMVLPYCDIRPDLLIAVEDVILDRHDAAAEDLTAIATKIAAEAEKEKKGESVHADSAANEAPLQVEDRIARAMLKGETAHIADLALEGYAKAGSAISVINTMLMPAMEQVGVLFGEGKLFLPQVVKSARVMKQAVEALTPYIISESSAENDAASTKPKVVLATVKGDVHDIGKNIVAVVLACNGYEIVDLGVMAEPENIAATAKECNAAAIGLSGLITPSLNEMIRVAQECERQGLHTPIIIGGATTTPLHTAVKIAPATSAPVIHAKDAADNPRIISALLSPERDEFITKIRTEQERLRMAYELKNAQAKERDTKAADSIAQDAQWQRPAKREPIAHSVVEMSVTEVIDAIDWGFFFTSWGLPGRFPDIFDHPTRGEQARQLYADARHTLSEIIKDGSIKLRAVIATIPAKANGDDIILLSAEGRELGRLPMLRSAQGECVSDFVDDQITLFALSGGIGAAELQEKYHLAGDDYSSFMVKFLADRLTEAMAEKLLPDGCRIAIGYPTAPDHSLKCDIFDLLDAQQAAGLTLTDNFMIIPGEAICGISLPRGHFFAMGDITDTRVSEYAQRRGMPASQISNLIRRL